MIVKMQKPFKLKDLQINGYSLLYVRLVWYSLAFFHLVVTALVTLNIDVTADRDPLVRAYNQIRWKLITCWFNMISLAYFPLCLYCDWCEKRDEEPHHVQRLRVLRDVVMTSILMPVTTFSDATFWVLFKYDDSIIGPRRVFEYYLPNWAQHSLHTISMVTVVVDLLLTPRRRPDSMKPRLFLMWGFGSVYCLVVYMAVLKGEFVYLFLSTASGTLMVAICVAFHVVLTICYYAQWYIIDYVWGPNGITYKLLKRKNRD